MNDYEHHNSCIVANFSKSSFDLNVSVSIFSIYDLLNLHFKQYLTKNKLLVHHHHNDTDMMISLTIKSALKASRQAASSIHRTQQKNKILEIMNSKHAVQVQEIWSENTADNSNNVTTFQQHQTSIIIFNIHTKTLI